MKARSKESIEEANSIIQDTIEDTDAIKFLEETLPDLYPDVNLGEMDLHEAVDVLSEREHSVPKGGPDLLSDLNNSLESFTNSKSKRKRRKRRKRK